MRAENAGTSSHFFVEGQNLGPDTLRDCDVQRVRRSKRQIESSKESGGGCHVGKGGERSRRRTRNPRIEGGKRAMSFFRPDRRSPILLVTHRTYEIAGILLLAFDFDSARGKPVEISGRYRTRRLWNRLELDHGTAVARNDDALALQDAVDKLGQPVLRFRHTVRSMGINIAMLPWA